MKVFIPEVEDPKSVDRLKGITEVKLGSGNYTDDELARELHDVDVVVIASQHQITRRVIERSPKLRGIVKYGSKPGSDNVDIAAANERKIFVAYTEGANADSVAEFTVTLALALAKRLPFIVSNVKTQVWRDSSCLGMELAEKTVGIFGLGVVGSKVAKKLTGLDMRVIAMDPYISEESAARMQVKLVDLKTLMSNSDVVTLHAKLTKETAHIIGRNELALMKPSAYFINTARGALTDETALYEALCNGQIAGAALDVFELEPPPPNNPLLTLENIILTPHVASWTSDALRKEASMAIDAVISILNGKKPKYLANPEAIN